MSLDQDFAEFVGARWASLYRLAYLLAASPTGAEDLLQVAAILADAAHHGEDPVVVCAEAVEHHRVWRTEAETAAVRRGQVLDR